MGQIKSWIRMKIFDGLVWVAVHLLGAKVNRENIVKEYREAPPSLPMPLCETCKDYVEIAGRPVHVSQLKNIENEWVDRGIIR